MTEISVHLLKAETPNVFSTLEFSHPGNDTMYSHTPFDTSTDVKI